MTPPGWGAGPRAKFLTELALSANVTAAATAAGYARETMFELRAKDADFAIAWDTAEETACQAFAATAPRGSTDGVDRRVVESTRVVEHNGQSFTIPDYSDAVLFALCNACLPEETRGDGAERNGKEEGALSSGLAIVALREHLVVSLDKATAHAKRVAALRAERKASGLIDEDPHG